MRRALALLLLAAAVLVAVLPKGALSLDPRLMVFEAFITSGCPHCSLAAPAIVQMDTEYGGSIVFLEHYGDAPLDERYSRFAAAHTGSELQKPYIIVDSGHMYTSGQPAGGDTTQQYYLLYKQLIEWELPHEAEAVMQGYSTWVGDSLHVYVTAQNLSSTALSTTNLATAGMIVYQDVTPGSPIWPGEPASPLFLTTKFVRDVKSTPIASLPDGATGAYAFDSGTFEGYTKSTLHAVAFVDYRPGITTGAYDMLQAVVPTPDGLTLSPSPVQFTILKGAGSTWSGTVQLSGPSFLTWTAASDQTWLAVSPSSLVSPSQATLQVDLTGKPEGTYTATVTFTATAPDGVLLRKDLPVSGSYSATDTNCYTLTLSHSGGGSDPVAAPAASDGCQAGTYHRDAVVVLTANAAVNWQVAGWGGTVDDASTAGTNSLTMPAAGHAAEVAYSLRPECVAAGAPVLSEPQLATTVAVATPLFVWQPAAGADSYRMQVCRDAGCGTVALDTTTASTQLTAGSGLAGGTYYWRVASLKTGNGCLSQGPWSTAVRFYVCVPPDAPALLSPEDGASEQPATPTLAWEAVDGSDEYEVQVDGGTYSAFATSITPTQALSDEVHSWRVRAHSSAGGCSTYSPWSVTRRFSVGTAAAPERLTFMPLLVHRQ